MEIGDTGFVTGAGITGEGIPAKIREDSPQVSPPSEEVSLGGSHDASSESMERLKAHASSVARASREYEETMSILLPHAKDKAEAEKDLAWLKTNIEPQANIKEMAEFYCIGKGRYAPDNPKREELLKLSLGDIQRYLDIYRGDEREEFREGLKTLSRAVPQTGLTDVIKTGYEQRRPDETLRESCERLIYDYGLLGDTGGRVRLSQKVKKGIESGDFP